MILENRGNYVTKSSKAEVAVGRLKTTASMTYHEMTSESHDYLNDIVLENTFSFFFILDLKKSQYLFLSKSIQHVLGFPKEFFLTTASAFPYNCIHPEDRDKMKKVQRKMMELFNSTPVSERKKLKFEYNIRAVRKDGVNIHLIFQTSFIEINALGAPLVTYNTCTDISRYKNDQAIKLSVFKLENHCHTKLFEQEMNDTPGMLTKRQKEIIELISHGFTSVEIANKLSISVDTVKNHRKKILTGTHCKNMAEAMRFVYRHPM